MFSSTAPIAFGLVGHCSGALWKPSSQTAFIADTHLGYSWAQRRRGELGPLADFRTKEKLLQLCNELAPQRLVFLGDLVHAPRPCQPEREWIETTLNELSHRAELISVRGNHDRAFAREFGHLPLYNCESWSDGQFMAVHGDRFDFAWPEGQAVLMGHLHPALPVRDASGAGHQLPVFLAGAQCVVLPAFSPFARGYNVGCGFPHEVDRCFAGADVNAFAITGKRVVSLGPLRQAVEKMFEADNSSPGHFRRPAPKV